MFDLELLLASVDIGVLVLDESYAVLYANEALLTMLGTTREALERGPRDATVIRTDGSLLPSEEYPARKALRTGESLRDVVVGIGRPDGTRLWASMSATVREGNRRCVVCTVTDVSRMQRAYSEREQLYTSVVQAMSEGVAVFDQEGRLRDGNPALCRMLGSSLEQLLGRRSFDPAFGMTTSDGHVADAGNTPSQITLRTGEPITGAVARYPRPGRSPGWIRINTAPLGLDPGAQPTGVVATVNDISDEREMLEELDRSNARVRNLLEAMPVALFEYELDDDGADRVTTFLGPVRQLFGVDAEVIQASTTHLWERIHPDDVASFRSTIARSAQEMSVGEIEVRSFNSDLGAYRWVRVRANPARRERGWVWAGVVLDITQSRALEEGMRVAQRREAMADLAAGIAHNFNNMLAAIKPNLDLAIDEVAPATRPLLEDARHAAESAADLVRRLFALTHGHADAESSCDLAAVAQRVVHLCRQTFDRAIAIELRTEVPRLDVVGRPGDHEQILLNLCLNARDALEGRPKPRIDVTLERARDNPSRAVVQVRDNGAGMTEGVRQRLGEPFFTTKPPGKGTGLGLATLFGTVRDLGGTVTCESKADEGTTFTLTLPASTKGPSLAPAPPSPDQAARGRILVVDDEPLVRTVLRRTLERAGWEIVDVGTGAEAVAYLERDGSGVAAMVLDLSLPDLPGVRVLEQTRTLFPKLPVVVFSGNAPASLANAGADAILEKPSGMPELAKVLRKLTSA